MSTFVRSVRRAMARRVVDLAHLQQSSGLCFEDGALKRLATGVKLLAIGAFGRVSPIELLADEFDVARSDNRAVSKRLMIAAVVGEDRHQDL